SRTPWRPRRDKAMGQYESTDWRVTTMFRSSRYKRNLTRDGRLIRRGVAATEFAIVAPVFFLMVIGFIEFGRAMMVQEVLINASRVGARMASTTSSTSTAVQSAVTNYATSVAVPNVVVTVTPDPATAVAGTPITVTASVPFD